MAEAKVREEAAQARLRGKEEAEARAEAEAGAEAKALMILAWTPHGKLAKAMQSHA